MTPPPDTSRSALSRRDWLRLAGVGALAPALSGWLPTLARLAASDPKRRRSCILLWMSGGPSQLDTFDPKPDHDNGGGLKPIGTNVTGIQVTELLPSVARHMDKLALIRSMSTREADHGRGSHLVRTGYVPQGAVAFPALGSLVSRELEAPEADLPGYVSIAANSPASPYGPGFLGPNYAPLILGNSAGGNDIASRLNIPEMQGSVRADRRRTKVREGLLDGLQEEFLAGRPDLPVQSHQAAYRRAVTLMHSQAAKAFDLAEEKDHLRERYGPSLFGQGCLLARRLVERKVPFVEVSLGGWDTHTNNLRELKPLCATLDAAWAALLADLKERGLLESTLVVWMGEFGRTPIINGSNGRDHWARGWSAVLGGGGIKGGQVFGRTSLDGMEIQERPVTAPDLLATIGLALGLDITRENQSNSGRPIRLVDASAKPIREALA
jgi:Protein of unknown function (DUF1501)